MAHLPGHVENLKELLVKNGFIKEKRISAYTFNKDKGEWEQKEGGGVDSSDADVEVAEEANLSHIEQYLETGYPTPGRRYQLVIESANSNIEEPYFWILEHTRTDMGNPYVEKITDTFSASEQSSFWGSVQSRISVQQEKASQYLRGISEMIKQLFQLVRELRILDEKLEPRTKWEDSAAADMALKAEYTDLVENRGGQIQPGSIYHLSQSVGYTILPDMFFNTRVFDLKKIDDEVDKTWNNYNTNVKGVLKRKLFAYINWKIKTDSELKSRREFTLKYLRQHWNTIKMYMNWTKPYLRNVERMQMNPQDLDSPDIIGSFETSTMEIEILAYKPAVGGIHPCILHTFRFRTKPELSYQKDQYQNRGPIHIGRVEISMRAYGWTKDDITAYKKFRHQEDMRLLGMVDTSIKDAMDALGTDLEKYLAEAGEAEYQAKQKAKEEAEKKDDAKAESYNESMLDPFISIFKGFGEIGGAMVGKSGGSKGKSGSGAPPKVTPKDKKAVAGGAAKAMFLIYKNYKKSHGFLSW